MPTPNKIAAIQTCSTDDIEQNLAVAKRHIMRSANNGAKVAVLPECFAFMQRSRQQLMDNAELEGCGPIQDFLANISAKSGVWIVAGSVPLRSSDSEKVTNSLLVFNHLGARVARYDKIFMFDVMLSQQERYFESDYTAAGKTVQTIATPVGIMGLSICYDLRFPELYRRLVERGAEVIVIPSAFAVTTGRDHWMPLLTARAIENSCYLVAPAQHGDHNGKRTTWGHSVIIDPWGKMVCRRKAGAGVIYADIDLHYVAEVREKLPSLRHKRADLFQD